MGLAVSLFIAPAMAVGTAALFAVMSRAEPKRANLGRSMKAFNTAWLGTMAVLLGTHVVVVLLTLGISVASYWLQIAMGFLFVLLGNYLGKVRRNTIIGVRTSWTLSSELSWNKSNRLAGWMLVFLGLALMVGAPFAGDTAWLIVLLAGALSMAAASCVYSYYVWKSDPNRSDTRQVIAQVSQWWERPGRIIALATILSLAGFAILVTLPLALGKVPPNPTNGFRVPETLSNPEVWYKVNAYAGRLTVAMSAIVALIAVGLFFVRRIGAAVYGLILFLAFLASTLVPVVLTFRYIGTL
jgi:uncharacterized membrane protein